MVHREMLDYDPEYNVKLLLQYGANPNLKCFKHLTPLHVATYGQFPSTVKALLDSYADVHVRDIEHCQTALHMACQRESCAYPPSANKGTPPKLLLAGETRTGPSS